MCCLAGTSLPPTVGAFAHAAWRRVPAGVFALEGLATLYAWHVAVLVALRGLWLLRPDPFGQPTVGKFEWWFFHALAADLAAAFDVARPALGLTLVAVCLGGRWATGLHRAARAYTIAACAAIVVVAQVDLEVMRFVGVHLNANLVRTYLNDALLRELPGLLREDAGGPFVGLIGLLAAPAVQVWLQLRAVPQPAPERSGRRAGWPVRSAAWALALLAASGLTAHWAGDLREWKVASALDVLRGALRPAVHSPLPDDIAARAAAEHAQRWQTSHPGLGAVFGAASAPLLHLTPWRACGLGGTAAAGIACAADGDADGAAQARDCDDRDPAVHPGAVDAPGDGIDQDCSGADAQPFNFLVVVLESHRGLGVGHVTGGVAWSPHVDALAREGLAQGRAVANALPTIGSFMALHTGLWACGGCQVATDFPLARLPSLPATLRRHGWQTLFFSAFDPAWDNQSIWLRQWYDRVDYDRSREDDAALFAHVARDLAGAPAGFGIVRPFFAVVTTRTNHFPFTRVAGVPTTGGDGWPDRMRDTMGWADAGLGGLLAALRSAPWFARTVVVVTGDHGYPLGEHGAWYLHETLHVEATGVPLVLAGAHPKLAPWRGVVAHEPAGHVDLAPTLLDLAGIDPSGAWVGRSLLRPAPATMFSFKEDHVAVEQGHSRVLFDQADAAHPERWRTYDRVADPRETAPQVPTAREQDLVAGALRLSRWMRWLYEGDRVLPPGWGPAGPP